MRQIRFKMERPGKLEAGQKVIVWEGELPSSYYYTVGTPDDPYLAMSPNIPFPKRLLSKEGIVKDIEQNAQGFYVIAEFDEAEVD